MPPVELLICESPECGRRFLRALTGTPARWCSKACRNRSYYLSRSARPRRVKRGRTPKSRPRTEERKEYESAYNRRPEVMERNRLRAQATYVPTPRSRKVRWPTRDIESPYQGHRWLEMARLAVTGGTSIDPTAPWADDRYDEMGEAVLALLEGRDMTEAVRNHRKREFVPRHLTVRISDMGDTGVEQGNRYASLMPTVESAEDTVLAKEPMTAQEWTVKYRYRHGKNRGRHGETRQQQPSRRRMQDAGINDKRPRTSLAGAGANF